MPKSRKRQRKEASAADASAAEQEAEDHSSSFGWKKVDVHLDPRAAAAAAAAEGGDWKDDNNNNNNNHYDHADSELSKRASRDLPAHQKEDMGMFYGLQVLDGSAYSTERRPDGGLRFIMHTTNKKDNSKKKNACNDDDDKKDASTTSTASSQSEEPATKKKKKMSKNKARKERKRKLEETARRQQQESSSSSSSTDDDKTSSNTPREEKNSSKDASSRSKKSKKKKKKQKDKKPPASKEEESEQDQASKEQQEQEQLDEQQADDLARMQSSWLTQTAGVELEFPIIRFLLGQNFWTPTPIQAATLPASILGRCNIVGAAPTGSGKTLAFLLPIVQKLLEQQQDEYDSTTTTSDDACCLQALIITPTRELAMQIASECRALLPDKRYKNTTVSLVGGLAHAKQIRILNTRQSRICVATPGRLWELISSREHAQLNDLSQIQFLVMDECDRMVQQASFPQLVDILDAVHQANPMNDEDDDEESEDGGEEDEDDSDRRMRGLPGIRGEAKVQMLSDEILEQLKRQQPLKSQAESDDSVEDSQDESDGDSISSGSSNDNDGDDGGGAAPEVKELMDDEYEQQMAAVAANEDDSDDDEDALPVRPPVHRQTFIYSATLTLPSSKSNVQSFRRNHKGKRGAARNDVSQVIDGAIAEILEKANAKGKTKVVDLTNLDRGNSKHTKSMDLTATGKKSKKEWTTKQLSSSTAAEAPKKSSSFRLPPGLKLQQIKCTQRHKDSHLYGYLMTTKDGLVSGPSLVFCNSIAGVRRVGATLQALGLKDVRILHAQMQQRARFKAVELLGRSNSKTIVVATDVAARGLDIPSVASVVHYDAARSVDGFVHRSGRTARGMGPKAVGCSLSLVAPGEDKMHNSIVSALGVKFEDVLMDGRLLKEAQERTNLATKVVQASDLEHKRKARSEWFQKQADDAGLEMDEAILQEGQVTDRREQILLREAQSSKRRLAAMLAQPMQTQRYGKFLSTNSAARQQVVMPSTTRTTPAARNVSGHKKKRRRHR